jgi:hypothetical protein
MLSHPEMHYPLAQARLAERRAEAASVRLADEARRAAPGFMPPSRWRDTAFWASLIGPIVGLGFLAYFVEQIARASIA